MINARPESAVGVSNHKVNRNPKYLNGKRILFASPVFWLGEALLDRRPIVSRVVFLNGGRELDRIGT